MESKTYTINLQPFLTPIAIVIAGLMICIVLAGGFIHLGNVLPEVISVAGATTTAEEEDAGVTAEMLLAVIDDNAIVYGDINSPNLFMEFSDPSCPYCHIASGLNPDLNVQVGERFRLASDGGSYVAPVPEMKRLVDEGKGVYVWKYSTGHNNGLLGSQALYCANEVGAFWGVHDLLMSGEGYFLLNEQVLNDVDKADVLADFTKSVVDPNFMVECLTSERYAEQLTKDEQHGVALGVQGTPGFFINTQNFPGAYSFTDMESFVR